MEKISAEDLGKRLPEILERIARSEHFTITDHGRSAAELRPVEESVPANAAVETILDIQRRVKPLGVSVREAIEEGRA
jgi:antitoxin (DNA-binding transcriptional repressor) of toxin-antitoxin stability system